MKRFNTAANVHQRNRHIRQSLRTTAFLFAALAASAHGQFDSGPALPTLPWDHFKLNGKTRVKLAFRGATVDPIITFYENISGVTIVKDPTLVGQMTLESARPVPLSTAFNILSTALKLRGYTLAFDTDLLVIRKQTANPQGGPGGGRAPGGGFPGGGFPGQGAQSVLKIYPIKFANASDVAKVLNEVYQTTTGNNGGFGGGGFGGPGGGPGGPPGGGGPGGGGPGGGGPGGGGPGGGGSGGAAQGDGGGFGGGQGGRQNGAGAAAGGQLKASADDFSNSVIVNASQNLQEQVATLLVQLDKPSDQPQRTEVYHLQYAAASDTATVVQNVLTSNVPRGRGGATSAQTSGPTAFFNAIRGTQAGSGQVVADTRTNALIVTATEDNQAIVAKVVTDIDHKVDFQSTTFVYQLSNARAESLASLIQQAYGTRQGVSNSNSTTATQFNGSIGSEAGTKTSVSSSVNQSSGRSNTGLSGDIGSADTYAMTYPSATEQKAMIQSGQKAIPLHFQDPNAQSGELFTSIGVTQGGPPGGGGGGGGGFGGGQFGSGGGGQSSSGSSSTQNQTSQGRSSTGQLVNTVDLTGQVTAIPDYNTNSLIVVTTPEKAAIVKAMLEQLDKIPQQVLIQTTIVEASLDASSKLGVEWSLANSLGKLLHDPTSVGTTSTNFGVESANATSSAPGFVYSITGKAFNAYLSALATDSKFQVLSTPRIFTTNNVQAQINVSQEIPYVTSETPDALGNPTYAYSFLNVGIILTIQPRILSNGTVTLDVDQTANELEGYTSVGNTQAPIVNQREAQTTVSVKDGETVILGGIISKQVTATVNKVPLLGDLPILGNLFRSTSKDTTRTELLVFLTPHVVNQPDDARKATEQTVKEMSPESRATLPTVKKP